MFKRMLRQYILEAVILLITLLGIAVFCCLHLELKDKLSSGVLWLTAMAVIYYAIETKRLRLVSLSQLKVQKETMKNEFLPIVYPITGMMQGQLLRLSLINKGKSIAKHIDVYVQSEPIFKIPSLSVGLPEENEFEWRDERISSLTTDQTVGDINIEFKYRDIYNRSYQTLGIKFVRDEPAPHNRFQLDRNNWEFKRKYNQG